MSAPRAVVIEPGLRKLWRATGPVYSVQVRGGRGVRRTFQTRDLEAALAQLRAWRLEPVSPAPAPAAAAVARVAELRAAMRAEIARLGGLATKGRTSPRKARSSAANGRRGGRRPAGEVRS